MDLVPDFTSRVFSELGGFPQVSGVAGKGFLCILYSVMLLREAEKRCFPSQTSR